VVLFSSSPPEPSSLVPLIIFIAEIVVVTLSTIRIIFISRGVKGLAALMGFFEVSIWLYAIGQVMQNLSDLRCSAAFAGGFTLGNYLGVLIHEKLALGQMVVRIITGKDPTELTEGFRRVGYGVTRVGAQGTKGPVQVVLTVIKRRDLGRIVGTIKDFDDRAFYSVDELHSTAAGVFPLEVGRPRGLAASLSGWRRRLAPRHAPSGEVVLPCSEPVT
jgi:uncharacterized protein YebE (UPF0316 family)